MGDIIYGRWFCLFVWLLIAIWVNKDENKNRDKYKDLYIWKIGEDDE